MTINTKKLKDLFGAEIIPNRPKQEEIEFINKRNQIEYELPNLLSIEQYLYYHGLFKEYGLEDLMLERTEHEIWYYCHYQPDEFRKSNFYNLFGDKRIIQKHFNCISEK